MHKTGTLTFARVYSGILNTGTAVRNSVKGKTERIGRMLQMHANERTEGTYAGLFMLQRVLTRVQFIVLAETSSIGSVHLPCLCLPFLFSLIDTSALCTAYDIAYILHLIQCVTVKCARAGDIVALVGLKDTTTGDTLCDPDHAVILERMDFPKPVIKVDTAVFYCCPSRFLLRQYCALYEKL